MTDERIKLVPPSEQKPRPSGVDVFDDLDSLRVNPDLLIRRESVATDCAVGKPAANLYFRANPDPRFVVRDAALIRHRQDKDVWFFVMPHMVANPIVARHVRLFDIYFLCTWPGLGWMLMPIVSSSAVAATAKPMPTDVSQRAAIEVAFSKWTNLTWDAGKRDFIVSTAESSGLIEPAWPPEPFKMTPWLKLGFASRVVDADTHPYVEQLRGIAS